MVLRRYKDTERDQETLAAVRKTRAAMDAMEYAFFKEGSVSWADVDKAREEYLACWDERRNFVLGEKYGLSREALESAITRFEATNPS